jgi:hypothetical protein
MQMQANTASARFIVSTRSTLLQDMVFKRASRNISPSRRRINFGKGFALRDDLKRHCDQCISGGLYTAA